MTPEEAVEILKGAIKKPNTKDGYLGQALDMAIKALEQQPCEDCISREAVISEIDRYIDKAQSTGTKDDFISFQELVVKQLPSVTPQPKKGHWIETAKEYYKAINEEGGGVNENTPYFTDDIACSECLAKFSVIDNETERFEYCPHCGTKMVEPQESEVKE